jgi:hypothetical protein
MRLLFEACGRKDDNIRQDLVDIAAAQTVLMYFVLPVWLAAGFADYLCHRATSIELTSGWKETLLHLLQLVEMAIPTLAAIFLDINARARYRHHDRVPHRTRGNRYLGCKLRLSHT